MDYDFNDLLAFDPLEATVQTTGLSAQNPIVQKLAIQVALQHEERLRDELMLREDTYLLCTEKYFFDITTKLGFETIRTDTVHIRNKTCSAYHMWNGEMLLIVVAEKTSTKVIYARAFFNIEVHNIQSIYGVVGINLYMNVEEYQKHHRVIFIGEMDVREAFIHKMSTLDDVGTTLSHWTENSTQGFLNLDGIIDAPSEEIFESYPLEVKESMGTITD